jgi:hypothetical protein
VDCVPTLAVSCGPAKSRSWALTLQSLIDESILAMICLGFNAMCPPCPPTQGVVVMVLYEEDGVLSLLAIEVVASRYTQALT